MSDEKFVELQDRHGDDFIALVSEYGELRLSNYEIVKTLNSFNTTCNSDQKLIAQQEERIAGQLKALEVAGRRISQLEDVESEMQRDIKLLRDALGDVTDGYHKHDLMDITGLGVERCSEIKYLATKEE